MFYSIKIKSNQNEYTLESCDKNIIQREMDLYFASFICASEDFKRKIPKINFDAYKTNVNNQTLTNSTQFSNLNNDTMQNSKANFNAFVPEGKIKTPTSDGNSKSIKLNNPNYNSDGIIPNAPTKEIRIEDSITNSKITNNNELHVTGLSDSKSTDNSLEYDADNLSNKELKIENIATDTNIQNNSQNSLNEINFLDIENNSTINNSNTDTFNSNETNALSNDILTGINTINNQVKIEDNFNNFSADKQNETTIPDSSSNNQDNNYKRLYEELLKKVPQDTSINSISQPQPVQGVINPDASELKISNITDVPENTNNNTTAEQTTFANVDDLGVNLDFLINQSNQNSVAENQNAIQQNSEQDIDLSSVSDVDSGSKIEDIVNLMESNVNNAKLDIQHANENLMDMFESDEYTEMTTKGDSYLNNVVSSQNQTNLNNSQDLINGIFNNNSLSNESNIQAIQNELANENTNNTVDSMQIQPKEAIPPTENANENEQNVLDFKLYKAGFIVEEFVDDFLICAYYIKSILKKDSFTMKFINSKLFNATGKFADMSVVDELIIKGYIKEVNVESSIQYTITAEGERYFVAKFQS